MFVVFCCLSLLVVVDLFFVMACRCFLLFVVVCCGLLFVWRVFVWCLLLFVRDC